MGLKCRTRTKGRDTGDLAQLCKIPGEIFHNASFLLKGGAESEAMNSPFLEHMSEQGIAG